MGARCGLPGSIPHLADVSRSSSRRGFPAPDHPWVHDESPHYGTLLGQMRTRVMKGRGSESQEQGPVSLRLGAPTGTALPPFPRERLDHVRSRDPDAMAQFFEHYFDRIFGLVHRLLGDRHLAEDVTQDVFLKAHRRIDRLDPARDPAPWLYAIATNACRDVWRSGAWRMARASTPAEEPAISSGLHDPGDSPEEAALRAEREQLVQVAITTLPGPLRLAVLLHDFEGLDHREVAGITGVSHLTARKRYSRALRMLAELLMDTFRP